MARVFYSTIRRKEEKRKVRPRGCGKKITFSQKGNYLKNDCNHIIINYEK